MQGFPSSASLPDGTLPVHLDGRGAWTSGPDKRAWLFAERTGPQFPGTVLILIIVYILYILLAYFVCVSTDVQLCAGGDQWLVFYNTDPGD